jgi:hypothetical protein
MASNLWMSLCKHPCPVECGSSTLENVVGATNTPAIARIGSSVPPLHSIETHPENRPALAPSDTPVIALGCWLSGGSAIGNWTGGFGIKPAETSQ